MSIVMREKERKLKLEKKEGAKWSKKKGGQTEIEERVKNQGYTFFKTIEKNHKKHMLFL